MGKPRKSQLRSKIVVESPASSSAEATMQINEPSGVLDVVGGAGDTPGLGDGPRSGYLPRRDFLTKGAATLSFLTLFQATSRRAEAQVGFDPFSYGVASGDPLPDRVIIWTRVNPSAEATPGSGLGPVVRGVWEVALDAAFTNRVAFGRFAASAAQDHTVKIDVAGLLPATDYYYRFTALGVRSPVGRTRTAPALGSSPASVRFGMVSCSNFEAGYFTAYRFLALRDDLDFILHLGDYIYEYAAGQYGPAGFAGVIRAQDPTNEITTLEDYRRRHACHKADRDLQALHARHPFIATWDDHETANNAWREGAENHTEGLEGLWVERKSAAIKAYYEWMPVRQPVPTGAPGEVRPIYRKFAFGNLMDLLMLDLRSYRDIQPADATDQAAINDPNRSMLGSPQTAWLQGNLVGSKAQWRLMGNSVQMAPIIVVPSLLDETTQQLLFTFFGIPVGTEGAVSLNVDAWDGYAASRLQILGLIAGLAGVPAIPNCVFLTGDIHSSYACDIPADPAGYATTPFSIATEFVCTSVTSDNVNELVSQPERVPDGMGGYMPNPATASFEALVRGFNAWAKDVNLDFHGFSVVDVTPARTQVDNFVVRSDASDAFAADPRTDPNATVVFRSAFKTDSGTQSVTPAAGQLGPRP